MDLIEISYHDPAASNADQIPGYAYLLNGWENNILSYYYLDRKRFSKKDVNRIPIKDTSFTLGNDHIELYDGIFKNEPFTDLRNGIDGCFTTCYLKMIIDVKDAIVKGKMCIRNANKDPINTEYELSLKKAEIEMTVGVKIAGYGIYYDYCIYKLNNIDIAFLYRDNSKMSPFLDKINNDDQKKLLELYLSEYCAKELYPAIEHYQDLCLSKYHLQQEFDESPINRNIIAVHNRQLHTAFNNLAKEIINQTNSLLEKESPKISLANFLGISEGENNQKIIKNFEGSICDFDSIAMIENKNVIVSKENNIVLIHVPIKVHKFSICCTENTGDERCTTKMELKNSIQTYTIDNAYFYLSLKRLGQDKVGLELKSLKILNVRALAEYKDKIAVDYLIMHKIEESIKEFLNQTLVSENLQEMAINPDFELDYHDSDFDMGEYESTDESEDEE